MFFTTLINSDSQRIIYVIKKESSYIREYKFKSLLEIY